MSWPRYGIGDRFISAGKDGRLILHFMDQATCPLNYANSVAIAAFSSYDGIVIASIFINLLKKEKLFIINFFNVKPLVTLVPEKKCSSSCNSADFVDPFRRNVPSTIYCATPIDADDSITHSKKISFLANK